MKKHMNTIEAFEQDIKLQENFIKKFKPERPLSKTMHNKTIKIIRKKVLNYGDLK